MLEVPVFDDFDLVNWAFEKQKNNSNAIEMLQKYISKTNDITAKNEINNYIEQLKNNIN